MEDAPLVPRGRRTVPSSTITTESPAPPTPPPSSSATETPLSDLRRELQNILAHDLDLATTPQDLTLHLQSIAVASRSLLSRISALERPVAGPSSSTGQNLGGML